jgi:hypothetical protein
LEGDASTLTSHRHRVVLSGQARATHELHTTILAHMRVFRQTLTVCKTPHQPLHPMISAGRHQRDSITSWECGAPATHAAAQNKVNTRPSAPRMCSHYHPQRIQTDQHVLKPMNDRFKGQHHAWQRQSGPVIHPELTADVRVL